MEDYIFKSKKMIAEDGIKYNLAAIKGLTQEISLLSKAVTGTATYYDAGNTKRLKPALAKKLISYNKRKIKEHKKEIQKLKKIVSLDIYLWTKE